MNNKVMIVSENKYLKDGLSFEIEKLGLKVALSLSDLDGDDIVVVDLATIDSFEHKANKLVYILANDDDVAKYQNECFLVRPFSVSEFDDVILALASDSVMPEKVFIQNKNLSIALYDDYIVLNGVKIELTKNEMLIFAELWLHKGKAVSRERLDEVIGANRDGNIVTVYINHLREKFSAVSEKRIIKTIRGGGYTISEI